MTPDEDAERARQLAVAVEDLGAAWSLLRAARRRVRELGGAAASDSRGEHSREETVDETRRWFERRAAQHSRAPVTTAEFATAKNITRQAAGARLEHAAALRVLHKLPRAQDISGRPCRYVLVDAR